jgi:hypothetical protein
MAAHLYARHHGGLHDVDGTGVVRESGDGGVVLWKSTSARANVGSGVRVATSERPLWVILRLTTMSAVRRLFIQLLKNLRTASTAALRHKQT